MEYRLTLKQKVEDPKGLSKKVHKFLHSPPVSPLPFLIERPKLPPQVLAELHLACAKIVQATCPASQDYDDVVECQVRNWEQAQKKAGLKSDKGSSLVSNPYQRRRREADPLPGQATRPINGHESISSRNALNRKDSYPQATFEPLEPTHTTASHKSRSQHHLPVTEDPIHQIRSQLHVRPKTSAAACIDYNGPTIQSTGTSSSTTRTNTTYDGHRASTGLTSTNMTPANRKSASSAQHKNQDASRTASMADATAKAFMAAELARRRTEPAPPTNSFRPPSRSSIRQGELSTRPTSRAGSIRENIRDYIRPRASIETNRSERSLSRSESGQSLSKGGSWWRGTGIRRRGSWSSFRSAKPDDDADTLGKEKGVDLNRALPALPGLDQYQEKKAPMHISQLMRSSKKPPAKQEETHGEGPDRRPRTAVIGHNGIKRHLTHSQERQRHVDLSRCVEEKMRLGAISPPGSPPIQSPHQRTDSLGTVSMLSGPSVQVTANERTGERKRGDSVVQVKEMRGRSTMGESKGEKKGFRKRILKIFGGKKESEQPRGRAVAA